uniref:TBC1 domain family, member 22B n=1 Tax=Salmo trutta TaxID=8032 RepID=A0A674ACH9_SALTR
TPNRPTSVLQYPQQPNSSPLVPPTAQLNLKRRHSTHQEPPLPSQQPSDTTREPDTGPGPADRPAPPTAEVCLQQEEDTDSGQINGRVVVKSSSEALLNTNTVCSTLQKQQSLSVRPIIPLVARISDQNSSGAPIMTVRDKSRLNKFKYLLSCPNTDLEELWKHNWSGIPREVRPITWRLLSGYLLANTERRDPVLKRKRDEYFGFLTTPGQTRLTKTHIDRSTSIFRGQTRLIPLFQQPAVQQVLEQILFIWAIRHPASGYVQGINNLVSPFIVVFLSEIAKDPGIQNNVKALEELVSRIDEDIHNCFTDVPYEVEYLQFAFLRMNKLLMRELPLSCSIRLWDTYQAEQDGFSHFHLYVCAAFLIE